MGVVGVGGDSDRTSTQAIDFRRAPFFVVMEQRRSRPSSRRDWTWPLRMRGALVDDVDDAMLVKLYSHATLFKAARFRALARLAEQQTDAPPPSAKSKSATVTSFSARQSKGQGSTVDR
jgi:hypothetical protein